VSTSCSSYRSPNTAASSGPFSAEGPPASTTQPGPSPVGAAGRFLSSLPAKPVRPSAATCSPPLGDATGAAAPPPTPPAGSRPGAPPAPAGAPPTARPPTTPYA